MAFVIGKSRPGSVVAAAFALMKAAERGAKKTAKPEVEPSAMAHPKGEKAKPGKRAPTKDEQAWLDWIVSFGCIACHLDGQAPRPTTAHHLVEGNKRMGHKHAIGLCDPGHHQGGQPLGILSIHPHKARFVKKYGTERELLAQLRALKGKAKP